MDTYIMHTKYFIQTHYTLQRTIYFRCYKSNMIMRNAVHAPEEGCKFVKKKKRGARAQAAWVQQPEEHIIDRNSEEMSTEIDSSPEIQPNEADGPGTSSLIASPPSLVLFHRFFVLVSRTR